MVMSRRRSTKKFYQADAKRDSKPMPAEAEPIACEQQATAETPADAEVKAAISAETLDRMLAAEAADREVSEHRTADMVGRYFKLTLAMVCANMVVAGANVAMLLRRPPETRTIVTMPAPAPAPAPATVAIPSVPVVAPPPVVVPPPVAPAPSVPLLGSPAKPPLLGAPAKTPLLGKAAPAKRAPRAARAPLDRSFEASVPASSPEPVRAVSPARSGSVLTARLVNERTPEDPPLAERW